jgi:methylglyoxal synthase
MYNPPPAVYCITKRPDFDSPAILIKISPIACRNRLCVSRIVNKNVIMITTRKMNTRKRIAFVANDNNRKSLIEWSYDNQGILKEHELIATAAMADILEGTVGASVTRLHDGAVAANQQLSSMIAEQQIDILLFFWDPVQPPPFENGVHALHDMALTHNVIIACNLATADFVLSSVLMDRHHAVPVLPGYLYTAKPRVYNMAGEPRRVVLKVNAIH